MEQSFIAWLKQRVRDLPQVPLGIGDDAAILAPSRGHVVTADSLCEGTHFLVDECGPRRVGAKLAGVNLSDIAAMGAVPVAAFLSLCLPRKNASLLATEIVEGVIEKLRPFGVSLAGGDTNLWDGPLVVHMTMIGESPDDDCWLRRGAQVGDAIVVSGNLGGSLLGKHLDFEPRIELARKLRQIMKVHAATDLSDGLGIDLLGVASQSGCGARLELDQIPISEAARLRSQSSGLSALDHALGDGEDFELLFAVSTEDAKKLPSQIDGVPLTIIGEFVSRTGLWSRQGGQWKQVPARGYVHR